jgi:hypothetical protein
MKIRVYKYGAVPLGGDDVLDTGRKTLPKTETRRSAGNALRSP